MPVGRYGHAGCLSNNQFIVFGGSNNAGYCDETVRVACSCLLGVLFLTARSLKLMLSMGTPRQVYVLRISPPPIIVDEEDNTERRRPGSQAGGKKKVGGITLPGLIAQIKEFTSSQTTAKPLSELMASSGKPAVGSPAKTMPVRLCLFRTMMHEVGLLTCTPNTREVSSPEKG